MEVRNWGSVGLVRLVDAREVDCFCNEVMNSDTKDKDLDRVFDEDETAANASDNGLESSEGYFSDAGCRVEITDDTSRVRPVASAVVIGVRGDEGIEGPRLPFMGVSSEKALAVSASYSSLTQAKAAATHKFFKSLPEYKGVSIASC